MTLRLTAIVIAALDAIGWGLAAFNLLIGEGDPGTRGLDRFAGHSITILFLLSGLPALMLAGMNRAPRLALGFALAFPLTFLVLLGAAAALQPYVLP